MMLKSPRFHNAIPSRLPLRRRMTAILGFNYLDGVLMMADTEESLGGDAKSECDKLHRFIFQAGTPVFLAGTVITGGSGDSHVINCANQELFKFFTTQLKEGISLSDALNEFARRFFRESAEGYQGLSGYVPIQNFDMLVAINIMAQKRTWLFRWTGNQMFIVPPESHFSVGAGISQIHPMLRDTQFQGTRESMLFIGLRMMFHAKRAVVGVGGKTEVIALENDGRTYFWGTDLTTKVEELVINFEHFLNSFLYLSVSNIATDVKDLEANIKKNFANFPKVLKSYRDAYKKLIKPSALQK